MEQQLGRRETKKLAVRTAVEQAARKLFAEHGYEATSVRQIADAGIERDDHSGFDEHAAHSHSDTKQDAQVGPDSA